MDSFKPRHIVKHGFGKTYTWSSQNLVKSLTIANLDLNKSNMDKIKLGQTKHGKDNLG